MRSGGGKPRGGKARGLQDGCGAIGVQPLDGDALLGQIDGGAAAAIVMTAPLAMAGPIDTACVRSDRARGNRKRRCR
ncbi:MAG: hypothetical protein ABS73_09540 [Paracoccus sp. SCN 68-21]|nr:MAG: hypothetical protein ABS73_09540 [Paracoccus sp. SCN 68-21]